MANKLGRFTVPEAFVATAGATVFSVVTGTRYNFISRIVQHFSHEHY